ncbi:serine hydroxymethyltransferase 6-like [Gossypium australe]|uniref:Serine hydroxymethyltransferase 6-like n=1 Tax=Gossypium australe TaxID=47621 RepID=A0A5B6WF15_9ROSI|nr:serine hydroxymethyltransferase 6-like [Gossypium australe]
MGLDTPLGENTSHGHYTPHGRKVSSASIFFESLPYKVIPQTGYIDYEKLKERALDFRPKILICGSSSYPREWDYRRFRQIADKCGAVLLCDMAQTSGLIVAKGAKRKGGKLQSQGDDNAQYDFKEKTNFVVFPSLQGGPHNNHIATLAIALKQVATLEYKAYMQQVKRNAQALASALLRRKCRLITGGTDNHLILWDLRPFGLTGKIYEKVCEMCHITLNKIAICGDNGAITPGGVRIAAHAATMIQHDHGKLQKASVKSLHDNKDILELRTQVETFASQFAMPGFKI